MNSALKARIKHAGKNTKIGKMLARNTKKLNTNKKALEKQARKRMK